MKTQSSQMWLGKGSETVFEKVTAQPRCHGDFATPPIGYLLDDSSISRSPLGQKALQDALGERVQFLSAVHHRPLCCHRATNRGGLFSNRKTREAD